MVRSRRARIILLWDDGASKREIAEALETSVVTVAKWIERYEQDGIAALESRKSPGRPREVSAEERSRIIALTRLSPPAETGLSHWSSYEMSRYLKAHEGIDVSHNFISRPVDGERTATASDRDIQASQTEPRRCFRFNSGNRRSERTISCGTGQ
jgi:transposase